MPHNPLLKMPTASLGDWLPNQIVYSKITYAVGADGRLNFILSPANLSYAQSNMDAFLTALANGTPPGGQPLPRSTIEPQGSLDLVIKDTSWIVIQLDPNLPWQFQSGHAAVTLKADYGGSNVNLFHVSTVSGGFGPPSPEPPGNGCQLAYFAAPSRSSYPAVQGINLHVELFQSSANGVDFSPLPVIIDPAIKNDGGIPPAQP
jgi:hypothetical protein